MNLLDLLKAILKGFIVIVFIKLESEMMMQIMIDRIKLDLLCITTAIDFLEILLMIYWIIRIYRQVDLMMMRL